MKCALLLLLLLAGCGDERPPVPNDEESARLNEAEEMLDDAARGEQAR